MQGETAGSMLKQIVRFVHHFLWVGNAGGLQTNGHPNLRPDRRGPNRIGASQPFHLSGALSLARSPKSNLDR